MAGGEILIGLCTFFVMCTKDLIMFVLHRYSVWMSAEILENSCKMNPTYVVKRRLGRAI